MMRPVPPEFAQHTTSQGVPGFVGYCNPYQRCTAIYEAINLAIADARGHVHCGSRNIIQLTSLLRDLNFRCSTSTYALRYT